MTEKNLTYAKAKEIPLALESAVQGTIDIQTPSSGTVHKVTEKRQLQNGIKCYRCGKTNHKAPQCQHKDTACNRCNKTGHLVKVCQSKKDDPTNPNSKRQLFTHVVTEQSSVEERQGYSLFTIHDTTGVKDKTDPLFVTMNLNGKQIPMEIDTGTAVTVIIISWQNQALKRLH